MISAPKRLDAVPEPEAPIEAQAVMDQIARLAAEWFREHLPRS